MEKIYMEENKKQKRGKQRQQNVDFSVVLSFVVAIFAIVSIGAFAIASNQGNNVSYAAPSGDTFSMVLYNPTDQNNYSGVGGTHEGSGDYFYIPYYYANTATEANRIYCIEHAITATNGSGYTKSDLTKDAGLAYILTHSYANGVKIVNLGSPYGEVEKTAAEVYATQAAIWLYLHETTTDAKNKLDNDTIPHDSTAELVAANVFTIYGKGSEAQTHTFTVSDMYAKIRALVDAGKLAAKEGLGKTMSITKAGDDFTKTEDGQYYQTALMTVTGNPSADLLSYDIVLQGIDGSIAVGEDGQTLQANVAPGTKFYVRIPVNQISDKTTRLSIGIVGHFNGINGRTYVAQDRQTVVVVENSPEDVSTALPIDIAGVPDTGMNTAQTIYFIGLIVLLCGVGIVYANAKPVENKQ